MERFNKLAAPATEKLRQLQKMVQDIKKNDGSILDKLRRLKSKPAPKVPARDYQGDDGDDSQWSDAEFDSDTYEDPQEDHDDSYEPPPSHRVFRPTPSGSSVPRGEYVDSCLNGRPSHTPRKPLRPMKTAKPLPPKPQQKDDDDDDEDYINPENDNDSDYVEPTEKPAASLYLIPSMEENSPPAIRPSACLRTPPQTLPPRASPRLLVRKPKALPVPVQQSSEHDEYEVCDPDNSSSVKSLDGPVRVAPTPLPRESRGQKPALMPRPDLSSREHAGSTSSMIHTNQKPTITSLPFERKRPKIPLPQFTSHKQVDRGNVPRAENESTDTDEDADILKKPWYASTCHRKTAEDALIHSNKDGSFLLRKSSGQDSQQPYTLVVFYNARVYNIPVRYIQASRQYALGRDKKGEERFSSVSRMIENHQKNSLVLIDSQSNSKDSTKLCYPVKP